MASPTTTAMRWWKRDAINDDSDGESARTLFIMPATWVSGHIDKCRVDVGTRRLHSIRVRNDRFYPCLFYGRRISVTLVK